MAWPGPCALAIVGAARAVTAREAVRNLFMRELLGSGLVSARREPSLFPRVDRLSTDSGQHTGPRAAVKLSSIVCRKFPCCPGGGAGCVPDRRPSGRAVLSFRHEHLLVRDESPTQRGNGASRGRSLPWLRGRGPHDRKGDEGVLRRSSHQTSASHERGCPAMGARLSKRGCLPHKQQRGFSAGARSNRQCRASDRALVSLLLVRVRRSGPIAAARGRQ
jgi:hypothetical protein